MSERLDAASKSKDRDGLKMTADAIVGGLWASDDKCRDEYADALRAIIAFFHEGNTSDASWATVDRALVALQDATERDE